MANKLKKEIKRINRIRKIGDDEKTLRIINKFLKEHPNNKELINQKLISLNNLGRFKELEKYKEDLILLKDLSDDYKNVDLIISRSYNLEELGHVKQATSLINKSLNYHPEDTDLINANMDLLENFQDNEDEYFLRDLISVNPNNSEAYNVLGRILAYKSESDEDPKFQEAMDCFDKSVEYTPEVYAGNETCVYIDKSNVLLDFKKYDDAIKTLDLIPDEHINSNIKYRQKAIIYNDLKKYDLALEYIDKAIDIEKDNVDPYLFEIKGKIYLCVKDYDEAIKWFDKALYEVDIFSIRDSTIIYKAIALKEKGKFEESLSLLNEIEENMVMVARGFTDKNYEKAQNIIKEINNLI
ncbi:MAG: hypothetical protein LBC39_04435 [Methanobrevibacter sp.]|jgi:tetratricopeptide (TPR) repeat protein|nr:hypothetical protein [Candidatus Methanovirga aequatorialis]